MNDNRGPLRRLFDCFALQFIAHVTQQRYTYPPLNLASKACFLHYQTPHNQTHLIRHQIGARLLILHRKFITLSIFVVSHRAHTSFQTISLLKSQTKGFTGLPSGTSTSTCHGQASSTAIFCYTTRAKSKSKIMRWKIGIFPLLFVIRLSYSRHWSKLANDWMKMWNNCRLT